MLRFTLQRLGERLASEHRTLDAIIVTGDISDKNNEGGYQAFLELVDALGPAKPASSRIVVLPGNHDVASGLKGGDHRRYERFVRVIRGAGFVTPLLSGVDPLPPRTSEVPKHIVAFDDLQIIPIDSSAYSQVSMNVEISDSSWANLERTLAGNSTELDALRKLRLADAARVSDTQLEAVRLFLASVAAGGRLPLRIAALHHHLLPVSTQEEVKAFESLTNLGLVRQFLRDQGITIVFHGHKHTQFSYLDYISSYDVPVGTPLSVRVLSGAAASGSDLVRTDVFRLVEIDPNSCVLQIQRVGVAVPGGALTVGTPERLTFSRPGFAQVVATGGCTVIDGRTVDTVYPQLVATVSAQNGSVEHVLCRIEHSPEIDDIAPLYPALQPTPGRPESGEGPTVTVTEQLEQFREVVNWWQFPSAPLGPLDEPAFTHGSRIKKYNGHLDQIQEVIKCLEGDQNTTRGIVVLLSPDADKISTRQPFPSFCLVQFRVEHPSTGNSTALNCTAYFRKQEVRYWWLVNLAELADLQRQICDALRQRHVQELRNIRPGSVTIIAARAHAGQSPPKVQVPRIDRYYSLSRERLFAMVNALVWEHMPNRNEYANDWRRLFLELNPPDTPDPDGVAIAQEGLSYVREEVGRHLESNESKNDDNLKELHRALEGLLLENREFALLQQKKEATSEKYEAWRSKVKPLIERVIELSYRRISAADRK
jgi:3',5'-cyclic AMP phosphodiesterase CpdA